MRARGLVGIDGRRAVALKLATEREQMIVHQTADHIEPQQNAVRSMTDRPHESAEVEISQGAVSHLYRKPWSFANAGVYTTLTGRSTPIAILSLGWTAEWLKHGQ